MGKRRSGIVSPVQPVAARGALHGRHVRSSWSLPSFAFLASVCLVLVTIVDPSAAFALNRPGDPRLIAPGESSTSPTQSISVSAELETGFSRDEFTASKIVVRRAAPAVGIPDPGTAQAIAYELVLARGWDEAQYSCLVALWNRESHWNVYATNTSSGAYGIPQALPGSKMATAGADWATNPRPQIIWGLGYIQGRYQDPCGAWASSQQRGWY